MRKKKQSNDCWKMGVGSSFNDSSYRIRCFLINGGQQHFFYSCCWTNRQKNKQQTINPQKGYSYLRRVYQEEHGANYSYAHLEDCNGNVLEVWYADGSIKPFVATIKYPLEEYKATRYKVQIIYLDSIQTERKAKGLYPIDSRDVIGISDEPQMIKHLFDIGRAHYGKFKCIKLLDKSNNNFHIGSLQSDLLYLPQSKKII